jgi:hypothetical protein
MAMRGSYRQRTTRRRSTLAVIAALLWVAGLELLPNLHLAIHDELAPHHHGAAPATGGGLVVTVTYGGHRHEDGSWHADEDDRAGDPLAARGDHDAAGRDGDPGHGAGSLAHRTLALHTPPPVVTAPLPVTRAISWIEPASDDAPRSPAAPTAVARGPPSA